jgi:hypothetical protein
MRTLFGKLAFVEYDDLVRIRNRAQAVRNHDDSLASNQARNRLADIR